MNDIVLGLYVFELGWRYGRCMRSESWRYSERESVNKQPPRVFPFVLRTSVSSDEVTGKSTNQY